MKFEVQSTKLIINLSSTKFQTMFNTQVPIFKHLIDWQIGACLLFGVWSTDHFSFLFFNCFSCFSFHIKSLAFDLAFASAT